MLNSTLLIVLAWTLRSKWTFFRSFVTADMLRSVLLLAIWLFIKSPNVYGLTFIITSLPVLLAIGMATLEAGREMNDKWHPYFMIAAILAMLLFPGVTPSRPRFSYLNVLYMGRFVACGSVAASLLISSRGVGCWRWTPHAALWALYCASDASTYLAVLRGVHDQASAFVMCFHCCCLAGWICLRWRSKANEI